MAFLADRSAVAVRIAAAGLLLLVTLPSMAEPERPVVGVFITDIYDLDPNSRSFAVQFWIWSLVPADAKIDPLAAISLRHSRSDMSAFHRGESRSRSGPSEP